jgi:hypothetical protein
VFRRVITAPLLGLRASVSGRAFLNPSLGPARFDAVNEPDIQRIELPWMNAITTARGLATLYAALSGDGSVDGVRLVRPASLLPLHGRQTWSTRDRVMQKPMGWSQGFVKDEPHLFSRSPRAFGHPGAGGSPRVGGPRARAGRRVRRQRDGLAGPQPPRGRVVPRRAAVRGRRLNRRRLLAGLAALATAPASAGGDPLVRELAATWPVRFARLGDHPELSHAAWVSLVRNRDARAAAEAGHGAAVARAHGEAAAAYRWAAVAAAHAWLGVFEARRLPTDPVASWHLLAVSRAILGDRAAARGGGGPGPARRPGGGVGGGVATVARRRGRALPAAVAAGGPPGGHPRRVAGAHPRRQLPPPPRAARDRAAAGAPRPDAARGAVGVARGRRARCPRDRADAPGPLARAARVAGRPDRSARAGR